MISLLREEASKYGDKLQVIPIKRLQNIKKEIAGFAYNENLNDFQKWIVNKLYNFTLPKVDFRIESIILIAIPHPSYAKVEFLRQGKKYNLKSLVMSDFDNTEQYLRRLFERGSYSLESALNLPLKRLAAKSGLATYGKNNICYVEGMGSFLSFAAYFSDVPCDNDAWFNIEQADQCSKCMVCFNNCPTGAINDTNFFLNNEKCLSYINESTGAFPDWVPVSAHHCVYDCLKCQVKCPMNKKYVTNVIGPIQFSEEETDILLSGKSFDTFPPALKQKSKMLGFNDWLPAIPRNLRILFELYEHSL